MANRKKPMHIVVVGGVATGPKAAARARRRDPAAEITIVEQGEWISYAGCGMPFYIGGLVEDAQELVRTGAGVVRDPDFFRAVKDITVRTQTRAEAIDRKSKELALLDLRTGERQKLPYDKLVLATGSYPVVPQVEGLRLDRVYHLAHPRDALAIRKAALARDVKRVAVIGAGAIGMEATDALVSLGLPVVLLELQPQVMPLFYDADMAALLRNRLESQGVIVRTGERLVRLEGDEQGNVRKVVTDQGEADADLVVLAIGVRPQVNLAQEAGLKLGATGAIAVDEYLQTSDPDIFAGGDCVENTHLVSGRKVYTPLGSTANKHGRIIGDNLTGGRETFRGIVGTAVMKVFGYNVGRTGLSEGEARALGYDVITATVPALDRAHYYPEHNTVILKLVAEVGEGRLLGAQALSPGDAVKRIDVAATALTFGATIDQLANIDLGYAPPFSTAIDALAHAANVARNKRDGLAATISPQAVREKLARGDDFILLDVRMAKEYQARRIEDPRVMLVELGELRQQLASLPREKEIITICAVGVRSYEAQTILHGAGFQNVKFMEGGLAAWPYEVANKQRQA